MTRNKKISALIVLCLTIALLCVVSLRIGQTGEKGSIIAADSAPEAVYAAGDTN